MTAWVYRITQPARRDLKKLDPQVRRRIFDALDRFIERHSQASNVIRLQGVSPPEYRLRVGEWRVRFRSDDDAKIVFVLRVLSRGDAYRK